MKHLAIDIGASGGKAVLGDIDGDRLSITGLRHFPNRFHDIGGHKHWDIFALLDEIRNCLKAAPYADSVGIDTWGVDYGYVGKDGGLMGLPFAYRDSRTEKSVELVHEKIPRKILYRETGIQFLQFNTIYQIEDDLRNRPWIVDNSDKLLMIPELLGYLMAGEKFSEYTIASTTGLLDVKTRNWSKKILKKIGFPVDRLLNPSMPGEIRLPLLKPISDETGCNAEYVNVACHDTASAVAAVPLQGKNSAYISSGTWSLVGMELDEPVATNAARDANFTNEGGAGGSIRFLSNVTGLWLLEELRRLWKQEFRDDKIINYGNIIREARKAPQFKSIINPDDPVFIAPDDMRIAIRDYCRATGQTIPLGIGPFSRCVFESLALAHRKKIRQLENLTGRKIEKIHVVGGGSRNEYLCQLTSDACGVPVIAGPSEATAIGNIIVQAMSKGLVGSISECRELISKSFSPALYEPHRSGLWESPGKKFELMGQV